MCMERCWFETRVAISKARERHQQQCEHPAALPMTPKTFLSHSRWELLWGSPSSGAHQLLCSDSVPTAQAWKRTPYYADSDQTTSMCCVFAHVYQCICWARSAVIRAAGSSQRYSHKRNTWPRVVFDVGTHLVRTIGSVNIRLMSMCGSLLWYPAYSMSIPSSDKSSTIHWRCASL